MTLSPEVAELFPAIMGICVAAAGYGLALYTRHVSRRDP